MGGTTMADPDLRSRAAQAVTRAYGSPNLYGVVYHNLGYASPGELYWAASANDASLRAAAAIPPDRVIGPRSTPINPFWYHGFISER